MNNLDSFPLILLCMYDFVEFVYYNGFKDLHNKNLAMMTWLPHILLTYLKNYFQYCTPVATKPKNLRGLMTQNTIYPRTVKEAEIILPRLMDHLRLCVIGDNMGMLQCPLPQHLNPSSSPPPPPRKDPKTYPKTRLPRSIQPLPPKILPLHLLSPNDTSINPV